MAVHRAPVSSRQTAAAAAAKLAVYETLLSFGSQSRQLNDSMRPWAAAQKQQTGAVAALSFPVAVPLGFRTRGRVDFENVTVAYRSAGVS